MVDYGVHYEQWLWGTLKLNSGYCRMSPTHLYQLWGGGGGGEDQEKSGWAIQYTILYYTMLNNVGVKTVKSFNFISKY